MRILVQNGSKNGPIQIFTTFSQRPLGVCKTHQIWVSSYFHRPPQGTPLENLTFQGKNQFLLLVQVGQWGWPKYCIWGPTMGRGPHWTQFGPILVFCLCRSFPVRTGIFVKIRFRPNLIKSNGNSCLYVILTFLLSNRRTVKWTKNGSKEP